MIHMLFRPLEPPLHCVNEIIFAQPFFLAEDFPFRRHMMKKKVFVKRV